MPPPTTTTRSTIRKIAVPMGSTPGFVRPFDRDNADGAPGVPASAPGHREHWRAKLEHVIVRAMKFTLSIAMNPLDQLGELARAAEEAGFTSIALPDSLFYSETVSADYPYTPDGSRFWTEETPWADPLVAAASMGAVTERLTFYTSVLKLGSRNPVLLARQVNSVAALTGGRFGLGLGIGWSPEEFEWCGAPYERRGKRF